MKLTTLQLDGRTAAARLDGTDYVEIDGYADLGSLLQEADWKSIAEKASGARHPVDGAVLAKLVAEPSKVLCVGLNYKSHITEMGRDLPEYPTLFAKFAETLTAPNADVEIPASDHAIDWEAELVVVVGKKARRVTTDEALDYVAGYTAANDISMREYQFRTKEWLQGKMWEATTPVGPVMVTADELDPNAAITTHVNGREMQKGTIGDLVHDPAFLVSYISEMITLNPGDLILTGTTGGVGRARKPSLYLRAGDTTTVTIAGIGEITSHMVAQPTPTKIPVGADPVTEEPGEAVTPEGA